MKQQHTITAEIIINREVDWLFDFTQNFSERKKWDKQTAEIAFMEGNTVLEKGAKIFTKSVEGVSMETEYLIFDIPTKIAIRMLNKSAIFKSFIGTWNYVQTQDGRTILKITYQFNLRFPYTLIKNKVVKKMQSNMVKKLENLESYLEENKI